MAKINNVYISTIFKTMKTLKSIFLTISGISLLFLTGCTFTQKLPYDEVYNSGSTPVPQQTSALQYTAPQPQSTTNTYHKGNVQVVNLSNNDSIQKTDTSQYSKDVVLIKGNTTQPSTNIYNYYSGLNFDNPYFGNTTYDWSLSGFNWGWGIGYYGDWNYPYSWYAPYYNSWGNPYYNSFYGWNSYSWGYPYSWYSPYTWNNPYYYGYYPIYYTNSFSNVRYGHRNTHSMGGNLPRNSSGVIMPLKSSRTNGRTNIKSTSASQTTRPALTGRGHETYKRAVYQKPERHVYEQNLNKSQRVSQRSSFQQATHRRSVSPTRPRYQKPKQYQSLENRNPRSSKEYFRPQTTRFVRTAPVNKTTRVNINTPVRRYNVYRPANMQRVNQRPVYRTNNNYRIRYQPTRVVSPYKSTRTYTPRRSYSPPKTTNTYRISSPRVSLPTTTTNTSGGSSGGRPHRR